MRNARLSRRVTLMRFILNTARNKREFLQTWQGEKESGGKNSIARKERGKNFRRSRNLSKSTARHRGRGTAGAESLRKFYIPVYRREPGESSSGAGDSERGSDCHS